MDSFAEKVGFAVGTGRCGTKFISQIVDLEDGVSSVHERNPLNETFHRYCKWYKLPVDDAGFIKTKADEIKADLANHLYSFEASAYLSLSLVELYEHFGAKIVLLLRQPDKVINSYLRKGWYSKPYLYNNHDLAPGYQQEERFHHFLGRIVPVGEEFKTWQHLTRVGKLAWYWQALNQRVLEQFTLIPQSHQLVVKIEELDYNSYLQVASFLGYNSTISKAAYDRIKKSRPNRQNNLPETTAWNSQEKEELEYYVNQLSQAYDYSSNAKTLQAGETTHDNDHNKISVRLKRLFNQ